MFYSTRVYMFHLTSFILVDNWIIDDALVPQLYCYQSIKMVTSILNMYKLFMVHFSF